MRFALTTPMPLGNRVTAKHQGMNPMRQRAPDQLRPVSLEPGFAKHAEGSCLVKFGDTHVLVTASLEDGTPGFLRGVRQGLGDGGIRHAAALHP